jgi:Fe-coproporphyrin III synthase
MAPENPEKFSRKTVAFSKDATNVFFHLLTNCNLKCRHCYINPEQHGTQVLDIETIKTWLDLFAPKGREANVIFLGGEPTLHPELSRAVKHAVKRGFTSVTIDTNGYMFHDIIDKVDPGEVDFFSFSLDGATRATNDGLRGAGSYEKCLVGVRLAKQRGFATSMIYTVSGANLHELSRMPLLVRELGLDRFFIQVIGIRGRSAVGTESGISQVSREEWLAVVPPVARAVAAQGITVTYPKVFLDQDDRFECAGLVADNYFIFPNGRVYRCPLCEDFSLHSAEVTDGRLVERPKITEKDLFNLDIPEGCVMNRLVQPDNLSYTEAGLPRFRIACCLLKEEIRRVD